MSSINIQQSQLTTEIVQPLVISKLYNYAKVSKVEDPSNELEMHLSGNIQTYAAKKDEVRYLSGIDQEDIPKFPDLTITVPNNNYCIEFEDPSVKSICVSNWGGATGGSTYIAGIDGEVTYGQLAEVTGIGLVFRSPSVTRFNEFLYFTKTRNVSENAFYGSSLECIKLPDNIEHIGTRGFQNCSSLKEINIPSSLTSVGALAFYGCGSVELTIPSSIKSIGALAFFGCSKIHNVTIGNDTVVGDNAFLYCSGITLLNYNSTLNIPNGCFRSCSSLLQVVIPEGVAQIGNNAFSDCTLLRLVHFPSTITRIGDYCFYGCNNINTFICEAVNPPVRYNSTIPNISGKIYVPDNSVNAYKTAQYWSGLANKIYPISELPT